MQLTALRVAGLAIGLLAAYIIYCSLPMLIPLVVHEVVRNLSAA